MSVPEVIWRVQGVVRDRMDRALCARRAEPVDLTGVMKTRTPEKLTDGRMFGSQFDQLPGPHCPAAWRQIAATEADGIARRVLTIFDLHDCELGDPIRWNYEHKADRATPVGFAGEIDYRDYRVTGDCKFVWEPNRHHQLVTLGRAFRYTGDEHYARAVVDQLESWMEQCPFGTGMNWRSPLELGIRLINWVWALELIRPSAALTGDRLSRIVGVAYRHLWDITRKYSRFSSANNHLIGEAAGVYIGSSYFSALKSADAWRSEAKALLEREIVAQTHPDGGSREQALGYQLFVTQFFLLCGLAGRQQGDDFSAAYWSRLEALFGYLATMMDGGEVSPLYGDCDDGYVLTLGSSLGQPRALMAVGASLFLRGEFKALAGEWCEPGAWLLGEVGRTAYESIPAGDGRRPWVSRAMADSGYYVLRAGKDDAADRMNIVFDCGELGYGAIAAHGHADALSFTLRIGGRDVFVDPGTYDYFTYGEWRNYFRSTRAHNTVTVDGLDQSELLGSFLWGRRAEARCLRWAPSDDGGLVSGEQNGYTRLSDPVVHRRTIEMSGRCGEIVITDEFDASEDHDFAFRLHCGEHCLVERGGDDQFAVDYGGGRVTVAVDPRLSFELAMGSDEPNAGWVSRGYHRREPCTTLIGRCRHRGRLTLRTVVTMTTESCRRGRRADGVL
ncbi:MAG: alginate lyase family protein, partial [Phycisphaerales bacterium]|nr:alginate lyase family protein [Phycisphaerales bacterium]